MEHAVPVRLGLRALLRADLVRQRELFAAGNTRRLWLSALSPRFAPVLLCRLAQCSDRAGLGPLAKVFSLLNFMVFGLEIAPRCDIGPGVFFPHTQGTVIGAQRIGANAVIYQGVTLGARDLDFTYDAAHRPVLGDNVMCGAGAKILGGITVGNNVTVGANSVLLMSVPDRVVVAGIPARVVRGSPEGTE
ncbi:serine acetyltransferase [Bordetella genomosp. 1]|uniref:Serine acetyltransferase n=1 Tax=Bordetella genomosp. 1 TaxID=1395607 RepID=A0A261RTP2_9BORD|nr:DapH/DapD/GlmU-related protein [Bordetella genomosp. 1]MDQ8030982.1 DapH/DapD/GlmU-related protein [Bordetella sp.]OZI28137.1 serine acetyltransferase [Bordetella genomosp. 1]